MIDRPLPADVEALLAAERAAPEVPDAVREQIWNAVCVALTAPPPIPWHRAARAAVSRPATLLAFAAGIAVGGAAMRSVPQASLVPIPAPVAAVVPTPLPERADPESKPPVASRSRAVSSPAVAATPSLADERELIEKARQELVLELPKEAVKTLLSHREAFPRGQLAEDREALLVLALAGSGDFAAARAAGESFRRSWPRSVFRPSVESSLESLP